MKPVLWSVFLVPLIMGNMAPPPLETYRVVTELAVGGKRECRGFDTIWSELVPMAGFTPLEVLAPDEWLAKKGEIVSFLGRETEVARVTVFDGADSCEPAQRRSDFRDAPTGTRLYREGLKSPAPSLVATDLRRFGGLRVSLAGDTIEVELGVGDLGTAVSDLQLVVHYDGCGKKPLGFERTSAPFSIAEGKPHRERFPALAADDVHGRGLARAQSVQVRGGQPVRFLLDRLLAREGITVPCP